MAKILVIDDIDFTRQTICAMLKRGGHEVLEASNGRAGLHAFNSNTPDLVVTDILMPEMEGLETIQKMKNMKPDIPIIAITGSTDSPFMQIALKFGAAKGLYKPFKQAELLSEVSKYISPV